MKYRARKSSVEVEAAFYDGTPNSAVAVHQAFGLRWKGDNRKSDLPLVLPSSHNRTSLILSGRWAVRTSAGRVTSCGPEHFFDLFGAAE